MGNAGLALHLITPEANSKTVSYKVVGGSAMTIAELNGLHLGRSQQ